MLNLIKKKIKILIFYFISLSYIICKILVVKNKKEKYFFINTEGGFGPSITRSHILKIMYDENWILFFGTKNKRHNKNIKKIFDNQLIFFYCGDLNQPKYKDNFEKFTKKVIQILFKLKFRTVESLILDLEIEDNDQNLKDLTKKKYNKLILFECGFFFKYHNKKNFYPNNIYKKNFTKFFKKFDGEFKGKINFFLRGKSKKYPNKRFIDNIRDARDIDDYKDTLEYLVESGYQIFLTGEVTNVPDWVKKFGNSVVYLNKTDFKIDDYNLYAMSNTEYFIGGSSGPPLFKCINNFKTLLLETNHLGISYLNSVVSYPKIKVEKLSYLKEIFMRCPYEDHYLEKIFNNNLIESLSKNDLKIITKEFIENINNDKYWKRAEDLGFLETHTHFMDAKISNYWLKLNNIEV